MDKLTEVIKGLGETYGQPLVLFWLSLACVSCAFLAMGLVYGINKISDKYKIKLNHFLLYFVFAFVLLELAIHFRELLDITIKIFEAIP